MAYAKAMFYQGMLLFENVWAPAAFFFVRRPTRLSIQSKVRKVHEMWPEKHIIMTEACQERVVGPRGFGGVWWFENIMTLCHYVSWCQTYIYIYNIYIYIPRTCLCAYCNDKSWMPWPLYHYQMRCLNIFWYWRIEIGNSLSGSERSPTFYYDFVEETNFRVHGVHQYVLARVYISTWVVDESIERVFALHDFCTWKDELHWCTCNTYPNMTVSIDKAEEITDFAEESGPRIGDWKLGERYAEAIIQELPQENRFKFHQISSGWFLEAAIFHSRIVLPTKQTTRVKRIVQPTSS